MANISNIVDVQISRQSSAVSRAGFGVLLFVAEIASTVFTERVKEYDSLSAVAEDFATTDIPYLAAAAFFSQENLPNKILIGRNLPDAENGGQPENYDTSLVAISEVNNIYYAIAIDVRDTEQQLKVAAYAEANKKLFGTSDNSNIHQILATFDDGTFTAGTITANVSIDGGASTPIDTVFNTDKDTTMADFAADIQAVVGIDTAVYTPLTYELLIDAAISSMVITFDLTVVTGTMTLVSDFSDDPKTAGILDIGAQVQALTYDRTLVLYNGESDGSTSDNWAEIAWFGVALPKDPGSITWKFKTLAGVLADNLNSGERTNLLNKSINIYESIGGVNITEEGTVASGEFIDIIRGVDWLEARLSEDIYQYLVNQDKVPYTDPGIAAIESIVRTRLSDGVDVGLLAASPQFTVTVPKVVDVDSADKLSRTLRDVNFEATLAGAIHKVIVRGVVTV